MCRNFFDPIGYSLDELDKGGTKASPVVPDDNQHGFIRDVILLIYTYYQKEGTIFDK